MVRTDGQRADGRTADGRAAGGRAGGRAVYGHAITKFSGMDSFLSYGTRPTRAPRARVQPRYETIPINCTEAYATTPWYGHYLTHAHNHITRGGRVATPTYGLYRYAGPYVEAGQH